MSSERGGPEGAYPKNLNRQIHGLRGFAALAVYVYHIYGMATVWDFWPALLAPTAGFFIAGRHGVEIFFIISGYLITGSLIRHQSAKRFLIDRAIRIYPVFLTIHLFVFAVGPIIGYQWLAGISLAGWAKAFLYNALFLPGLFHLPIAQPNAWSLSFEAAFYLISAVVFLVASVAGRWMAAIGLAVALVPILSTYPVSVFFVIGAVTYFLTTRRIVQVPAAVRVLSLPALALTLALLALAEQQPRLLFLAVIPGFIFFWSIVDGRCLLSSMLRWRGLQYLGTISYSFYLWSPVVTYPMKVVIQRFLHGRLNDLIIVALFAVVGFIASIVVADGSYRLLEDRTGKALHRWAGSLRRAPILAGSDGR